MKGASRVIASNPARHTGTLEQQLVIVIDELEAGASTAADVARTVIACVSPTNIVDATAANSVEKAENVSAVSQGLLTLAIIPKLVASGLLAGSDPGSLIAEEPIEQTNGTLAIPSDNLSVWNGGINGKSIAVADGERRKVPCKAEVIVVELSEQSEEVAGTLEVKAHMQERAD
jgi:hypothetical protein